MHGIGHWARVAVHARALVRVAYALADTSALDDGPIKFPEHSKPQKFDPIATRQSLALDKFDGNQALATARLGIHDVSADLLVTLASVFHDMGRVNDARDKFHGPTAEVLWLRFAHVWNRLGHEGVKGLLAASRAAFPPQEHPLATTDPCLRFSPPAVCLDHLPCPIPHEAVLSIARAVSVHGGPTSVVARYDIVTLALCNADRLDRARFSSADFVPPARTHVS
eukprot:gnl/Ergobibamus_cyprinoides/1941.p1 GENE.gnl/Ergobibamus_cyprinoides/1941~~gnl/Ergobibamus_cyprinoides/1941.p1  ORF type:complete len:224 (+),score=31.65 gnl/Ergobibamus_cyprinoides/1941:218-889(+)